MTEFKQDQPQPASPEAMDTAAAAEDEAASQGAEWALTLEGQEARAIAQAKAKAQPAGQAAEVQNEQAPKVQ